jgi:hypothetical protein
MGWQGNPSQMNAIARRINELKAVPEASAERVAEKIPGLLNKEFSTGTDPSGIAWADLAEKTEERGRSGPPLTDTGAMKGSMAARIVPGPRVQVTLDHPSLPHQKGWKGRSEGPARPILPEHNEWQKTCTEAVRAELRARGAK